MEITNIFYAKKWILRVEEVYICLGERGSFQCIDPHIHIFFLLCKDIERVQIDIIINQQNTLFSTLYNFYQQTERIIDLSIEKNLLL